MKDTGVQEQTFRVNVYIIAYTARDYHPSFLKNVKKYRKVFAEFTKRPGNFLPADALDRKSGTCYAE